MHIPFVLYSHWLFSVLLYTRFSPEPHKAKGLCACYSFCLAGSPPLFWLINSSDLCLRVTPPPKKKSSSDPAPYIPTCFQRTHSLFSGAQSRKWQPSPLYDHSPLFPLGQFKLKESWLVTFPSPWSKKTAWYLEVDQRIFADSMLIYHKLLFVPCMFQTTFVW